MVLVTVTILVTEEASVITVPLVAAMVVEYFVAVGMSIMDGIDGNNLGDVRRYSDFWQLEQQVFKYLSNEGKKPWRQKF